MNDSASVPNQATRMSHSSLLIHTHHSTITLTTEDVVRHRLVKEIIKAYDKTETEERARRKAYNDEC
jgi:hypothetical protein